MYTGFNVEIDALEAPFTMSPSNSQEIQPSKLSPNSIKASALTTIEEGFSENCIEDFKKEEFDKNGTSSTSDASRREQDQYGTEKINSGISREPGHSHSSVIKEGNITKHSKSANDQIKQLSVPQNKQILGESSGLPICEPLSFF